MQLYRMGVGRGKALSNFIERLLYPMGFPFEH